MKECVNDFEILNSGHVSKGKQMKLKWEQTSAGHMDCVQLKSVSVRILYFHAYLSLLCGLLLLYLLF